MVCDFGKGKWARYYPGECKKSGRDENVLKEKIVDFLDTFSVADFENESDNKW